MIVCSKIFFYDFVLPQKKTFVEAIPTRVCRNQLFGCRKTEQIIGTHSFRFESLYSTFPKHKWCSLVFSLTKKLLLFAVEVFDAENNINGKAKKKNKQMYLLLECCFRNAKKTSIFHFRWDQHFVSMANQSHLFGWLLLNSGIGKST